MSVLVVTGAAATGKSTIGNHLRGLPGLLIIDGDVLGIGAAAVHAGKQDYVGFWRYVLSICHEIGSFLALVSDAPTIQQRIQGRPGSEGPSLPKHIGFNEALRISRVQLPHTLDFHDVATTDEAVTMPVARDWALQHTHT